MPPSNLRKLSSLLLVLQCLIATSVAITFSTPANAVDTVSKEAIENTQKTPEASYLDLPRIVLKNGSTFMVLTPDGMMTKDLSTPYGVYKNDTRTLCCYSFAIDGAPFKLVTSSTHEGYKASFDYVNLTSKIREGSIAIKRNIVINAADSNIYERLVFQNNCDRAAKFDFEINYDFDFKDMFEVRGQTRNKRGQIYRHIDFGSGTEAGKAAVQTVYTGLDNSVLKSGVNFLSQNPDAIASDHCHFTVELQPKQSKSIEIAFNGLTDALTGTDKAFEQAQINADMQMQEWRKNNVSIETDNETFNKIFKQAIEDLYILKIDTPKGPGYAAGLPWYAVAFGRDQIISSLQTLDFAPHMAKEVITLLARYQGVKEDKFTEETPGKIMHELRTGEMARCKEIPFIPYYGTIDATPLWLVLISRYVENTGDTKLAQELWPNIELALHYLRKSTPDDFLYYGSRTEAGKQAALTNQAWKDSGDSVMHKDGKLASAPIAICEVQGYLYDAYDGTARLANKLGKKALAAELKDRAIKLKTHFDKSFWLPRENFVALALDATAEPCDVVTSNPGHLLNSALLDGKQAEAISARLMKPDMFSGWGIRTLSSAEKRYDPQSYHDGSVWPHDNALIVEGMAKTGHKEAAAKVISALFDVAAASSDKRLPELFCGYPRKGELTPVPYKVSCVPQLWCVGSIFEMVKSMTGLSVVPGKVSVDRPGLPAGINSMTITFPPQAGEISSARQIIIKRNPRTGFVTASEKSEKAIAQPTAVRIK